MNIAQFQGIPTRKHLLPAKFRRLCDITGLQNDRFPNLILAFSADRQLIYNDTIIFISFLPTGDKGT